jgi:phosphatidate cytidylyltransferase
VNVASASPQHPGSFSSRAFVSSVVIVVFASLCWADATELGAAAAGWWLTPVAMVIAAGAAAEAARMTLDRGLAINAPLVAISAALLPLAAMFAAGLPDATPLSMMGVVTLTLTVMLGGWFVIELAGYRQSAAAVQRLAAGFLAAAAIGLPLAFMVSLRVLGGAGPVGLIPLVSMVAVVKGGDIAAYVVGSSIGRCRMAPRISPGKTWEGAAASIAASTLVAWLLLEASGWTTARPWGGWPVYGLTIGLAGMLGDLSESLVKRELGVKDSGRMLGGLGGFLDVVDAPLFAAPVAWLLWALGTQA